MCRHRRRQLEIRWTNLPFLLIIFVLSLSGCNRNSRKASQPINLEDLPKKTAVILQVEGVVYVNADFEKYLRSIVGQSIDSLEAYALSLLFDKFIEEKLLVQVAREKGVTLSMEEEREYLARLGSKEWTKEERDVFEETYAEGLQNKMLIDKYVYQLVKDLTVEGEEIDQYYALHTREFLEPERVKVSQILLDTEEKAVEVLKRVKDLTEDEFREAARRESVGPEAARGGEMGIFKGGQLPFDMEKVIFSLKEGEISQVFESNYGFHIFRLDEKYPPELVPGERAATSIRLKILDQKIKESIATHIAQLKEKMEWISYPENLSFPYQRNNP